MGRLSSDLLFFQCPLSRRNPCENCGHCAETKASLAEYHRLAALYPSAVPDDAPTEVKMALYYAGKR